MHRQNLHSEQFLVNEAAALIALDGNRELLRELAQMFCEDAPEVLEELRRAVEEDNAVEARRAAHSLKGLISTFFATEVIELAQRLEQQSASGNLGPLKTGGLVEITVAVNGVIDELAARQLLDQR